jgi:membrane protease YdiL (CAAX protease family)
MRLSGDTRGLEKNPMPVRDALAGFGIAAGLLAVMTAGLLAWGAYVREEPVNWAGIVPRAIFTGIIVALLEEWIFRGIFLGVALRSSRPWTAIIVVSALFSILHLVKAPDILVKEPASRKAAVSVLKSKDWPDLVEALRTKPSAADWMIDKEYQQFAPGRIHWRSGIEMTAAIFKQKAAPALFVSEFLTLFAIGVILARARCATRSLWLPIGLHAGWVFANAVCLGSTKVSDALGEGKFAWTIGNTRIPWIGHELKIGLLPLLTLMVTAVAVEWWLQRRGAGLKRPD